MAMPNLLETILPRPALPPAARLQIYADAYFARLHQVLSETFPRVVEHTGTESFRRLTIDYLRECPSRHPSVGYVGARFAAFLDGRDGQPGFLADLARLEWAQAIAFEAPDADVLTTDALRSIPADSWPQLRFSLVPSLSVLELAYPVERLWRDPSAHVDEPKSVRLRVWRDPEYRVLHALLDPVESTALQTVIAGGCFEDICAAFAEVEGEEAAAGAISLLVRWLDDGILAASDDLGLQ